MGTIEIRITVLLDIPALQGGDANSSGPMNSSILVEKFNSKKCTLLASFGRKHLSSGFLRHGLNGQG